MTEFEGIAPAIASALTKRGYSELTPVQRAVLDSELKGADALVSAQTGSGKTVAFGLAIATTLLGEANTFGRAGAPLALAIAPTRELALQVSRELEWLYEMTGAIIATSVGGMDVRTERRSLERGAHIVVGTPGRLRDHITRKTLDLSSLKAVILDEADEMLDLGFREDLEFILDASPAERRTLMFSATVPRAIATLAASYQRNAVRISTAAEKSQHVDIDYRALAVAAADRENAIINVLRFYEAQNAIVFCNTRAAVNHLTARLNNRGFTVVALSGELSQNERTHALQSMRDGRARVCIATDVAARGIDLPNLELVIHADLPTNPDTLLHRSGRTGRAGRKGVSAIIVPGNARRKTERLLQNAQIRATWASAPSADEVIARDNDRILEDPSFDEAVTPEEQAFTERLIERHGVEKVAAAFLRQFRRSHSAPEDIIEIAVAQTSTSGERRERTERPDVLRSDFERSVWISLSVGRRQNAEPRWLIPMLCRAGNITRHEIGAIKMQPEETFVELTADSFDGFMGALGPNKTMEKGITVRPLDGQPDFAAAPKAAPRRREEGARPSEWKSRDDRPRDDHRKGPPPKRKPAAAANDVDGDRAAWPDMGMAPARKTADRDQTAKPSKPYGKPSNDRGSSDRPPYGKGPGKKGPPGTGGFKGKSKSPRD